MRPASWLDFTETETENQTNKQLLVGIAFLKYRRRAFRAKEIRGDGIRKNEKPQA
jgi:hypothetical protein